ncbi:MAG: hypothetical protein MPN21_09850 [Thermoanaerobaculia bacterium]|nr:hypothetical protein [Thermoanaerobaculia bacterium]
MSADAKNSNRNKTPGRITAFLDRLSTSNLVFVVAAIFAVDLIVPDAMPFIDEVILGVLTILLARWRTDAQKRAQASETQEEGGGWEKPPPKNVTPE